MSEEIKIAKKHQTQLKIKKQYQAGDYAVHWGFNFICKHDLI